MTAALRVIEHRGGHDGFAVRDYLTRGDVPFVSVVVSRRATHAEGIVLTGRKLPLVVFPDGVLLENPTPAQIAEHLGWVRSPTRTAYDLLIYGAGPAGLSAAVYAASEGLRVAVIERDAIGGQAGSSSLIENYLGFSHGISGAALADQARRQAIAFGAELIVMRESVDRSFADHDMRATLADGSQLRASAVLSATGVRWRRLDLPRADDLEGAGLYYGAGTSEVSACTGRHVYVVGGANSAGQAALNLAAHAAHVTMLVRGGSLSATMSAYLTDRIAARRNVTVMANTKVIALHGDDALTGITLDHSGETVTVPTEHLFVCIGGSPNTDWAERTEVRRDSRGFVLTGADLRPSDLHEWPLEREPYFLETSVPGLFAAGDVRANSIKRVASAVGEGAMAVTLVHRYLAER